MIERIKDWIDNNPNIVAAVVLIGGLAGFFAIWHFQPVDYYQYAGKLVAKEYAPSTLSTGVGTGISSSGQPVTVVTTTGDSEAWVFVLENGGQYKTFEVPSSVFYSTEINTDVLIPCARGKWIPAERCY